MKQFRIIYMFNVQQETMDIDGADMISALKKFHHKYMYSQPSNNIIVISITAL